MSAPEPPPGLPRAADGAPTFAEPWQARAFALTLALHARGVFAWTDWAGALGDAIARDPAPAAEGAYWRAWMLALEAMLARRGIASLPEVAALTEAWRAAARATPHGTPIRLGNAARRGA